MKYTINIFNVTDGLHSLEWHPSRRIVHVECHTVIYADLYVPVHKQFKLCMRLQPLGQKCRHNGQLYASHHQKAKVILLTQEQCFWCQSLLPLVNFLGCKYHDTLVNTTWNNGKSTAWFSSVNKVKMTDVSICSGMFHCTSNFQIVWASNVRMTLKNFVAKIH